MEEFFARVFRRKGKFFALLEVGRPWNGMMSGLIAVVGLALSGAFSPVTAFLLFILFTLAYMAGSTINDIYDEYVDRFNMPFRPLQESRLTRNEAWNFTIFLHIVIILIAVLIGWEVLLIAILSLIMGALYSIPPIRFCGRGVISQIELCIPMVMFPFFGGLFANGFILDINRIGVVLGITLMFTFIFLFKDFKDIEGDKRYGKFTAVIQLGERKTIILGVSGVSLFLVITVLMLWRMGLDVYYLAGLFLFLPLFIYIGLKIRDNPSRRFGELRLVALFFVLYLLALLL
ncbi:MAG: hypothetical protein DRP11_00385 [Candidatus Aenigmatarchaeota archaeon]|nr:MAG: hypothetical protein DRP11_00385 [Candidatus Aenigmarchaeota archaeon]